MKKMIRATALLVIPVFFVYALMCLVAPTQGYCSTDKVTKFTPESGETDPIGEPAASSGSSWWKWALGILVIGGIAAAAGGGGGGGSSSGGGSSTSGGTINVGW